jgi:hypothetical protein
MPRYEVIAPPATAYPSIGAALMPPITQNRTHGGPWWANLVTSTLGTVGVTSPKPGVHSTSADPRTAPSHNSPDVFFPQESYALPTNCHGPVPITSNNMMPVPATSPDILANIAMKRPRIGGQSQVSQPAVTQSWPDLYAKNNGHSPNGNAGWKD